VIEQVVNVCHTTVVREAWARGQELAVHGWIYGLGDGLLRDLGTCVTSERELSACYEAACAAVPAEPLYGPIRMNKDSDSGRVSGDDVAS
jgi:carbonic anhydrase